MESRAGGRSGPCEQNGNISGNVKALSSRRGVLSLAACDNRQGSVRQRSLERERLRRRRPKPSIDLVQEVRITGIALGWIGTGVDLQILPGEVFLALGLLSPDSRTIAEAL